MENKTQNQQVSQTPLTSPSTPQPISPTPKSKLPLILGGLLLLLLVGGGAYYLGTNKAAQKSSIVVPSPTSAAVLQPTSNQQQANITVTPIPTNTNSNKIAGWKTYTDPNNYFSFQYPSSWTFKNGMDFKTDAAVYDPTDMKKWPTNGGGTVSWPTHFIDILSVETTTKTAKQEADEYEKSWNMTDTQINRISVIKNGVDFEFYDLEGENAVRYRNVAISNGKVLIKASSSINKLGDGSVESQILNTFQFSQ